MVLIFALIMSGIIFLSTHTFVSYEQPSSEITPQTSMAEEVLNNLDSQKELGIVTRIVDGDTIIVEVLGGEYVDQNEEVIVRLANINTPETVDPRKPVECMGREASEKTKNLSLDQYVLLYPDPTQSLEDRYGRWIRYVVVKGNDLGEQLLLTGYAHSVQYGSSSHPLLDIYEKTEQQAKDQKIGLWDPNLCSNF